MNALIAYIAARTTTSERGQGLAEYALILALVALVVIASVIFLGDMVKDILDDVGASI